MKTSFMLSVSVGIVLLVATALLWWTLDVTQVFSTIGRTVNDIAGSGTTSFDFLSLVGFSRVMGVALVLVAIEIVLWSALATLFAFESGVLIQGIDEANLLDAQIFAQMSWGSARLRRALDQLR